LRLCDRITQVLTPITEEYDAPAIGRRKHRTPKFHARFKIGKAAIDHRVELLECINGGGRLFDQSGPPNRHQCGKVAGRAMVQRTVNELRYAGLSRRGAGRQVTHEGNGLLGPRLNKCRARSGQQKQPKYQKPYDERCELSPR
jgi:hypothetical protein